MTAEPIQLQTIRPDAAGEACTCGCDASGGCTCGPDADCGCAHEAAETTTASTSTGCACGHEDEGEIVLDVRQIPHAIRHATIFGALGAIAPGFALDLVADHLPAPLVAQLEQRHPGEFAVRVVENGPEQWRLRFARR
jgi:uncharacterized protein (DUF2249 family)